MATQPRKSPRKTQNSSVNWTAVILGALLLVAIIVIASGPIQSPLVTQRLWNVPTQATEAPATEAPAAATEAPTEPPAATEEAVAEAPAAVQPADRIARLIELDKVYRAQGWMAWLKAAGVTCDAAVEARQPEEETVTDAAGVAHVVVSGLQVKGNCQVPYPAVVTTDRPGEVTTTAQSRTYQPDLKNPSVMYTDVDLHGQGTIWVDASNWSQMDPTK